MHACLDNASVGLPNGRRRTTPLVFRRTLPAPPSETERELATCYGVAPSIWQMFEDEQHPPGIERRGARQGGRKRRKPKPAVRRVELWKRWE